LSSTAQVVRHFDIQTMFKVRFPLWVKRIGRSFYLGVRFIACIGGLNECPRLLLEFTLEVPMTVFAGNEVFVFDPGGTLVGMSSFGPPPECLKGGAVYFRKGSMASGQID